MDRHELQTRFEEMFFQGGERLDLVLRSLDEGSDSEVKLQIHRLDDERVGMPTSDGDEYESGYFNVLGDHIDTLRSIYEDYLNS